MVLFGWGWVILRWGSVDLLLLGQHLVGVGICVHIRYSGWRWFFVLPNGRSVPPSAGYLKRHQVTKCPCSWLGPTSSGSFTPATLRGPAAIRHPWREPTPRHLRSACTQVAIGGVWTGAHEDQDQDLDQLQLQLQLQLQWRTPYL
jgi:hypothetical protein